MSLFDAMDFSIAEVCSLRGLSGGEVSRFANQGAGDLH